MAIQPATCSENEDIVRFLRQKQKELCGEWDCALGRAFKQAIASVQNHDQPIRSLVEASKIRNVGPAVQRQLRPFFVSSSTSPLPRPLGSRSRSGPPQTLSGSYHCSSGTELQGQRLVPESRASLGDGRIAHTLLPANGSRRATMAAAIPRSAIPVACETADWMSVDAAHTASSAVRPSYTDSSPPTAIATAAAVHLRAAAGGKQGREATVHGEQQKARQRLRHERRGRTTSVNESASRAARLPPLSPSPRGPSSFSSQYDIVLLIDSDSEIACHDCNFARQLSTSEGIQVELRSLPAGDAMWVARSRCARIAPSHHAAAKGICRTAVTAAGPSDQADAVSEKWTKLSSRYSDTRTDAEANSNTDMDMGVGLKALSAEEYVLDFLVEFTRAEDLVNAIRSRRFRDQRLRLQRCGIHRLLCLADDSLDDILSSDDSRAAMIQSELEDGYGGVDVQPICLSSPSDLQQQYADITTALQQQYQEAAEVASLLSASQITPTPCAACQADEAAGQRSKQALLNRCSTFEEFVRTCREVQADIRGGLYGHTLLQIPNMPVSVAGAIMRRYPSLRSLMLAYDKLDGDYVAQKNMLRHIVVDGDESIDEISHSVFNCLWA